eukprot:2811756-Lingulodinium_polyedra.AAC.1
MHGRAPDCTRDHGKLENVVKKTFFKSGMAAGAIARAMRNLTRTEIRPHRTRCVGVLYGVLRS